MQVGPLLVRPASAAGFVAQEIPNPGGPISLVAFHGSRITYLASQAFLDRIVFSRGTGGDFDIWVCNLDGSNATRLLDNAHRDWHPVWSPRGDQIAFDRTPLAQDSEIVVINADGSGAHALTVNGFGDDDPSWSPTGDQIVFSTDRDGDREIYTIYTDGSTPTDLTNSASHDRDPQWSQNIHSAFIVYQTDRDGNYEIYRMGPRGEGPTRLTKTPEATFTPALSRDGAELAFSDVTGFGTDIFVTSAAGLGTHVPFVAQPGEDAGPAWSADSRFICYSATGASDAELWLRETAEPFASYRLTTNAVEDYSPDLGSPTLQTDRVIIGPAGSDWGGGNPIWSNADAGVAAYATDGYRNFVRIGVPTNQLSTLSVTPLASAAVAAGAPLGVVVEAADIVNLREDGGRGEPTRLWQLDPLNATAFVLYFDPQTGKLLSALVLRDQTSPAGVGSSGPAVTQRAQAGGTVAEGSFAAVFDAKGARVADAASEVRIANGQVTVVR